VLSQTTVPALIRFAANEIDALSTLLIAFFFVRELYESGCGGGMLKLSRSGIESRQRHPIAQYNATGRRQANCGVVLKLRHRTRHRFDRHAQIVGNVLT